MIKNLSDIAWTDKSMNLSTFALISMYDIIWKNVRVSQAFCLVLFIFIFY